jgi:hypothetical protein
MNKTSIRATLAGFIGGVAFIIGCGGGGGGGSTNSAVANTTAQVQDVEEQYCYVDRDGDGLYKLAIKLFMSGSGNFYLNAGTPLQQKPNARVYCATYDADGYTETTFTALRQGNWKTYNTTNASNLDGEAQYKMWRAVLR